MKEEPKSSILAEQLSKQDADIFKKQLLRTLSSIHRELVETRKNTTKILEKLRKK